MCFGWFRKRRERKEAERLRKLRLEELKNYSPKIKGEKHRVSRDLCLKDLSVNEVVFIPNKKALWWKN